AKNLEPSGKGTPASPRGRRAGFRSDKSRSAGDVDLHGKKSRHALNPETNARDKRRAHCRVQSRLLTKDRLTFFVFASINCTPKLPLLSSPETIANCLSGDLPPSITRNCPGL